MSDLAVALVYYFVCFFFNEKHSFNIISLSLQLAGDSFFTLVLRQLWCGDFPSVIYPQHEPNNYHLEALLLLSKSENDVKYAWLIF